MAPLGFESSRVARQVFRNRLVIGVTNIEPWNVGRVASALERMLPAVSSHSVVWVSKSYDDLFPAELEGMENASPVRLNEFAAGRRAARAALTSAGHRAIALPRLGTGAAFWPEPFIGSITHCKTMAASAVLDRQHYASVGIDLQEDISGYPDISSSIGALEELSNGSTELRDRWQTVLFSAKESIFKACSNADVKIATFREIVLIFDDEKFTASSAKSESDPSLDDALARVSGEVSLLDEGVASAAWLTHSSARVFADSVRCQPI